MGLYELADLLVFSREVAYYSLFTGGLGYAALWNPGRERPRDAVPLVRWLPAGW